MLSASTHFGHRFAYGFALSFLLLLLLPTLLSASATVAGPRIRIENMTKIPGSNVSFPADDFFSFSRILNPVSSQGITLPTSESGQMRIHNSGGSDLKITKLTTTNTANFKITGVSIPSTGLIVGAGKYITVTVKFVTADGDPKRLLTEKLVIASNAENAASVDITFRGAYMRYPEGGSEINAMQVFQSFGFSTEMGKDGTGKYIVRPSSDYPRDADVIAGKHGDLVLSPQYVQADPSKPVQVLHMAAFHGPGDGMTRMIGNKQVLVGGVQINHGTKYHQTLMPNASNTTQQKTGITTAKLDQPVKIEIAGFKTIGGTPNGDLKDKILGVRMYKVIDAKGKIVPNTYIGLMDYIGTGCGQGSHNCDWNDNVVYFSNIRPEGVPTAGAIANKSISAGQATSLNVSGSFGIGYPGNKLKFSAVRTGGGSLPSWVSLNEATGVFSFTPPSSAGGASFGIQVKATDLNGLAVTSSFNLTVGGGSTTNPNQNPVARATVSKTSGTAPLTVTVDASGSSDSDGNIVQYAWNWPGGSATGQQKTLTLNAGSYPITLTVTDDDGAKDTDVVTVTVTAPPSSGSDQTYWLEAECAEVGSKWTVKSSSSASNGKYAYPTATKYSTPTESTANWVRFTVQTTEAAAFKLFARLNAPDGLSDSYYVRVNGGSWYSWSQGLNGASGFVWKKYDIDPLQLRSGTNTIDVAFREEGTLLDKLMLTTTTSVPGSMGGSDPGCDGGGSGGAGGGTTPAWLETECGELGSGWSIEKSSLISSGSYLAFRGTRDQSMPDGDDDDRIATYRFQVSEAGSYHIYLRINAPSTANNSVWLKVDGGEWKEFWKELGGADLLTNGFEWKKANNDGVNVVFNLSAGEHTIALANREKGTFIDKIYVGPTATPPTSLGGQATNCTNALAAQALSKTVDSGSATEADLPQEISVFPNPAGEFVNLRYRGASDEQLDIMLLDMNGRIVRSFRPEMIGSTAQLKFSTDGLPSGLYHFRILSDRYDPVAKPVLIQ